MKVHYRDPSADWNKPLLCVTHTDRSVDYDRCGLNFLSQRYSDPNRLPPSEPFDSLIHSSHHSPHLGEATIWDISESPDLKPTPRLLAHFRPETDKVQHVIWYRRRLWVLGNFTLEVFDESLSQIAVIHDPWLSGGHTVFPSDAGDLLVSCSASDSVLVVDTERHEVVKAMRLPESLYGFNYPLSRSDSVVDHFVANDAQLTHINSAYPWRGGTLVSTLMQGAIGWFDEKNEYRELARGFVGCHGAKADKRNDRIYFCDSCLGVVVFLTDELGIESRTAVKSSWLHDAEQIADSLFALSVSDWNSVVFMDLDRREIIHELSCESFGASTQFLYFGQ